MDGLETLNAKMDAVGKDVEYIRGKVDGWPDKCEIHRGNIHERINKIYWWIIGPAATILVAVIMAILRVKL